MLRRLSTLRYIRTLRRLCTASILSPKFLTWLTSSNLHIGAFIRQPHNNKPQHIDDHITRQPRQQPQSNNYQRNNTTTRTTTTTTQQQPTQPQHNNNHKTTQPQQQTQQQTQPQHNNNQRNDTTKRTTTSNTTTTQQQPHNSTTTTTTHGIHKNEEELVQAQVGELLGGLGFGEDGRQVLLVRHTTEQSGLMAYYSYNTSGGKRPGKNRPSNMFCHDLWRQTAWKKQTEQHVLP